MRVSLAQQLDRDLALAAAAGHSPRLHTQLAALRLRVPELVRLARAHAFDGVEANGFFSLALLILKTAHVVRDAPHAPSTTCQLEKVTHVLERGVELALAMDGLSAVPEAFEGLLSEFGALRPHLDAVYGHFVGFWLCASMSRTMRALTCLMAVYAARQYSPLTCWRALSNAEFRARAVASVAHNADVHFVRSLWSLVDNPLLLRMLPALSGARASLHETDVHVPRQTRFRVEGACVVRDDSARASSAETVRCRLFARALHAQMHVVVHAHGGGFVAQSPESHALYLRGWAERLEGAAILSVDYSLSPAHRFPEALQQLLDVFLWLQSTHALPFHVHHVLLCGDSAGGNLALATCLAVALVRRLDARVVLPRAVLSFYAPLELQTRASPSRLLSAVDPLLPLGALLTCLGAYLLPLDHQGPWYRRPDLPEQLRVLNALAANPLVSPVHADARLLCECACVRLYLLALHFDACLDDSVRMAARWRGPVTLDAVEALPHGFLNLVFASAPLMRALLVTANVGALFEPPLEHAPLTTWAQRVARHARTHAPHVLALHLQETGGKQAHVASVARLVAALERALPDFPTSVVFADTAEAGFTALASFYCARADVGLSLFDFSADRFRPVEGRARHSGSLAALTCVQKLKFPSDRFPEHARARKGFMRVRLLVDSHALDLVNVHLFHDADNVQAARASPSQYALARRHALQLVLDACESPRVPLFLFGDFNFRLDARALLARLSGGHVPPLPADHAPLVLNDVNGRALLRLGAKRFELAESARHVLTRALDTEPTWFEDRVTEEHVAFGPSYPIDARPNAPNTYASTRCPAWCDRVLMNPDARALLSHVRYEWLSDEWTGDHKAVALSAELVRRQHVLVRACGRLWTESAL